ncbi:hypothetical protein FVEG_14877 [Fusarium verticillioides 7600]|nr:hypothetical protein FVEG_14877 [Fusarium verticillioides 7600]XP_018744561.1 hypothetical protein FVEG_14877 [Fusarium verticillioides 7600]XP_018744562.1 hypothetical protein FVEG_14877 [Fusarium verticillioides 7600]XP_018744563.1 hypothetical protein FVEG_14877 [Fusarium verticillioides 7600]XP_018744564.1 hypothetical protein FVEG_14877 [Fusarium verticillioides 7600]XP_018744565.1 hypothetical protein FVEG_14877 [Fusarium verticillioides 7600]XP_018744566.1 hypothetical protein FVEG_
MKIDEVLGLWPKSCFAPGVLGRVQKVLQSLMQTITRSLPELDSLRRNSINNPTLRTQLFSFNLMTFHGFRHLGFQFMRVIKWFALPRHLGSDLGHSRSCRPILLTLTSRESICFTA